MSLLFSSCLNMDDSPYVQDYVFMGTVTTGGASPVFQLDEGFSVTPETVMPADTFQVGERYYLHFILGDTVNHPANLYPIRFYRYGKTVVKDYLDLPQDSTDKWKDQPVDMANIWYSGHYCNLFFVSFMGVGTPNTFELVRMMENENTTPTDTVPKLVFELRHNAPEFSTFYSYFRFYSYDLSKLQTDFPNAVRFQISLKWNDYRYGTQTYTRYYTPNQIYVAPSLLIKENKQEAFRPKSF